MDCKTARLFLDYARPRPAELPGDDAAALERHLAACPECEGVARAERDADARLARAVQAVPAPEGLRARLLGRLAAERRAWYRKRLGRAGVAALAAALLLAVGLWYLRPTPPPFPDLDQVAYNVSLQKGPKQVEDWFQDHHPQHAFLAPREIDQGTLNYDLLTYYDVVSFQGKQVPMLLFVNGNEQARVYVLSERQFTLLDVPDSRDSQGVKVLYQRAPGNPDLGLIIIYTNSLRQFLTGERPPAA
jgi:hypothetical protein